MKRATGWLLIITLTFVLGVTATTLIYLKTSTPDIQKSESSPNHNLLNNENVSVDLPILNFCELSNNPEKYNGKIVRVSATMEFGMEASWFSNSNCGTPDNVAIVLYKNTEVWKPIERAREQKNEKFLANELNVIVIGRFKNEVYKNCCLIAPFQFEISEVEKVSKTN